MFAARVVFTLPNIFILRLWWDLMKWTYFIYLFYINWSLSGIPAWPANLPQRRPQPPEVSGGYTSDESVGGTREKFPPRRIKHRIAAFQWFCAYGEIFHLLSYGKLSFVFKQKKTITTVVGLWNFWLCPRIWLSYGPPSVCLVVHHVAARARAFPRAFVCQETVDVSTIQFLIYTVFVHHTGERFLIHFKKGKNIFVFC
jgi:hypothetical protein